MTTVSIQEAQSQLMELIRRLHRDEEIVITENNQPVARLCAISANKTHRQLGSLKGTVLYMAPDFDAPLDEFHEYMR